jgi:hypothetical protein
MKRIYLFILCSLFFISKQNLDNDEKLIMVVNFIRHGHRTPSKMFNEVKGIFNKMDTKKLTLTGFKQMILLGKYFRKHIIDQNKFFEMNSKNEMNNIKNQYLIFSSPSQRAIDSAIAYSQGLFPEGIYKIKDINHLEELQDESIPPLMQNLNLNTEEFPIYNLIIENKDKDTLFHARKCKFKNFTQEKPDKKEFEVLSEEERAAVLKFLEPAFSETLKQFSINDKLIRNIYMAMRSANKHYIKHHRQFDVTKEMEYNLQKLFSVYKYFNKISTDEVARLQSSAFFEHMLGFFEAKVNNSTKVNFYDLDGLVENVQTLKLITYSGHDGNLVSIIKNFLHDEILNEYFERFDI